MTKHLLGPNAKPRSPKKVLAAPRAKRPDTRVKEEQLQVDMVKMVGGKPQTVSKQVNAANQADAIKQATMGDPQAGEYAEITATAMDGAAGQDVPALMQARQQAAKAAPMIPGATAQTTPQGLRKPAAGTVPGVVKKGLNGLPEGFDAGRFAYPYSMMLPEAFRAVLKGMVKEGVEETARYGRIYLKVTNEAAMTKLATALGKSKSPAARTVIQGIMDSVK